MRHGSNKPHQPYAMKPEQERVSLQQANLEKDIRVIFDNKLLFRENISKRSATANRNIGVIFKSFTYLDNGMFLCLYKSLVRPHIENATTV